MVYFVDEDVNQLLSYSAELKLRRYDTMHLRNADEAFETLIKADNITLVIVDIMLATGESSTSKYTIEGTDNFLKTGVSLIKDLIEQLDDRIKDKIIIFSQSSSVPLVTFIRQFSDKNKIPYLIKKDYGNPFLFANEIELLIKSKGLNGQIEKNNRETTNKSEKES